MSSAPFISRDDLGDRLGRDLSADDSALACVDAACDICRTMAEQNFNEITDEITLDGTGTDALLLPERPVSEVTSVTERDEALTVDDDYRLNGNGVLLRTPPLVWPTGRQNVVVEYTHGYPDDDFPRDIRMVALNIATRLFTQGAGGISSESLGQYSVSYITTQGSADLSNSEAAILRKHRQAK